MMVGWMTIFDMIALVPSRLFHGCTYFSIVAHSIQFACAYVDRGLFVFSFDFK